MPGSLVGVGEGATERRPDGQDPQPDVPAQDRRGLRAAFRHFLDGEGAGAVFLLGATVIALLWANSPWRAAYGRLWATAVRLQVGTIGFHGDVRQLVNQGLMTLFFFVVGLEIKRELVHGQLRHWKAAALPAIAAVGGMVVPALVYLVFNAGRPGARGWAVPMATDIAFAVAVLAVLGSRVPSSLKLFLLTLAVVDDVGAVLVIAVVYSSSVHLGALLVAALFLGAMAGLARARLTWVPVYVALGLGVWVAVHASGVHATLAGAALGLLAPTGPGTVSERLGRALTPVTSFLVLPLFALANAGLTIGSTSLDVPGARTVAIGVVLGLVVGKVVGIAGASWLAVRARVGALPSGARWPHLVATAAVGGIGFTVSVFVADVAFTDPRLEAAAKLGVLVASTAAALVGGLVFVAADRRRVSSG